MAKKTTTDPNKPKLSLEQLTANVSAFNMSGASVPSTGVAPPPITRTPAPLPEQAPAALPTPTAELKAAPDAEQPAPVTVVPAQAEPKGEKPGPVGEGVAAATSTEATPAPQVQEVPANTPTSPAPTVEVIAPPVPAATATNSAADENFLTATPESAPVESESLDIDSLFQTATTQKGTMLRITADHKDFFTSLGFALGNGASAPDIIHNILTQFRKKHEAILQKKIRKAIQKKFS